MITPRTFNLFKMFFVLPTMTFVLAACTLKGQLEDISTADIAFVQPTNQAYTNDIHYNFKVQINSNNQNVNADHAVMQIYEGPGCDPDHLLNSSSLQKTSGLKVAAASSSSELEDGKTYSARVVVTNDGKSFQSACSPSVGVDLQNPNPVTVSYPAANNYVSQKELMTAWSTTTDNGISGLSDIPYRLRLYGQAGCAGPVLQTANSSQEQYKFKKLTQGMTYSVQLSSVDKAGNESPLACSAYTEVDVNAPSFRLYDPTSADGYTRNTTPNIAIDNDASAAYWCLTTDTTFAPHTYTDPCPSGAGGAAGWYTSRPTAIPLPSGEGLKIYNLWIVRGDGSLISRNVSSNAVTLDQTPPGAFTVTGVGGLSDVTFDTWLTSAGQPEVKWAASTDAVDYTVEIRTLGNALVCSKSGATGTQTTLANCPVLTDTQTYKVHITAYDAARNPTSAPDFNFTVDRDPPGSFNILGISGGTNDTLTDTFFGAGSPTVEYSSAANSSHYRIEIKDLNGITVCSQGQKAGQSGFFDYATESGVVCTGLLHGGTYRAYVSAFDDGENETQAANNGFLFQVDTVVPVLTLSPVATPTLSTSVTVSFTVTDALSGVARVRCKLDGGAYSTCVSPISFTGLSEGAHTASVEATDVAGNVIVQTASWTNDYTRPTVALSSAATPFFNTPTISVTATFSEDVTGFDLTDLTLTNATASALSGGPQVYTFTLTPIAEGLLSVAVLDSAANDLSGNPSHASSALSRTYDVTPPSLCSFTSGPTGWITTTTTTFGYTCSDDRSLAIAECRLDANTFADCGSITTHTLTGMGQGAHTFEVRGVDSAGNAGAAISRSFSVDSIAPTVSITSSNVNTSSPSFNFSGADTGGSGLVSYQCQLDGVQTWTACGSGKSYSSIGVGTYTFRVRSYDLAGNVSAEATRAWSNGGWTAFGSWYDTTACNVACGGGTKSQQQDRTCTSPATSGGGVACTGVTFNSQVVSCNTQACALNLTIASNTQNLDVRALANANGYTGQTPYAINLTINGGVVVGANSTGAYALDVGSWPGGVTVTITNYGTIIGAGGAGGTGGSGYNGYGSAGSAGGPALLARQAVRIYNYGTIAGGGGGGGGGGTGNTFDCCFSHSGGGGGGGAGWNGGAGAPGGDPVGGTHGTSGAGGSVYSGGAGGVLMGTGGSVPPGGYSGESGDGGTGGGPGQPGNRGYNAWQSPYGFGTNGGPGGAAGSAIVWGGNISWGATGSILGPQN